jgi:D-glycero-alpha-D-manno-heptose-7-phosphate kinase
VIIVRSPLRISFGGGGTDLPSYYRHHEGFFIAAAVDKYVYVTCQRTLRDDCLLRYSRIEQVKPGEIVQHPIIREALDLMRVEPRFIEITSMADIPAGTGLGSSGSFTTALLKALHEFNHKFIHPHELAELACHIELERLKEPIGKQDQYIAAYGGVTAFSIARDGTVTASPVPLDDETRHNLEARLLLFFTGFARSASSILADQDQRSKAQDPSILENLHYVKDLGYRSRKALIAGNLHKFGELMHEHWENKRKRSIGVSNSEIDRAYTTAVENGAVGGKLIGAGGGGFLMFYTEEPDRLRAAMRAHGLMETHFRFDTQGTKVVNP